MTSYDNYNLRADLHELRLSSKDAAMKLGTTEAKVCDYANGTPMPSDFIAGVRRLVSEEYAFRCRTGMSSDGRKPYVPLYAVEVTP